tara:strand:+ start:115 stop:714 length:600 start_codon:yes stop_codon:yes gene_type:complete
VRFNFLLLLIALFPLNGLSQEKELFDLIITDENATSQLLPEKMMITQRIFWGEKGILRKTGLAPLNFSNRQKEMKLRRSILKTQQILEYATFGAMIAQVVVGDKYYSGDDSLYKTHKTINTLVNASYFTGTALSLFSPPPIISKKTKGFNSKANKFLSTIHFTAMILTNVVDSDNKKAHKAAAYTAFSTYAAAEIVFKF